MCGNFFFESVKTRLKRERPLRRVSRPLDSANILLKRALRPYWRVFNLWKKSVKKHENISEKPGRLLWCLKETSEKWFKKTSLKFNWDLLMICKRDLLLNCERDPLLKCERDPLLNCKRELLLKYNRDNVGSEKDTPYSNVKDNPYWSVKETHLQIWKRPLIEMWKRPLIEQAHHGRTLIACGHLLFRLAVLLVDNWRRWTHFMANVEDDFSGLEAQ